MIISSKNYINKDRIPSEYFQDSYSVACWPLLPGYGLIDTVGGNHLIAADVLNGRGDFTTNADLYWGVGGSTISGGKCNISTATTQVAVLNRNSVVVVGKYYNVSFDIVTYIEGSINPRLGSTGTGQSSVNAIGSYSQVLYCSGTPNFVFDATNKTTCSIDNLTVREVYDGNISSEGAYFNGVSNCLQSTRTVDLSGTNKITIYLNARYLNWVGSSIGVLIGQGTPNYIAITTGFEITRTATPTMQVALNGDGGINQIGATGNTSLFPDLNFHSIAATMDKSIVRAGAIYECDIRIDGRKLPINLGLASNNTNNFGNNITYLGARGMVSGFFWGYQKNILIRSTVDSPETIADYYAWQNDKKNRSFVSMYIFEGKHIIKGTNSDIT